MIQFSLKSIRTNAGFTMVEAAKEVGIHPQTLSSYEKDSSNISMSLLEKLSNLYQVPIDYIFLGKEYDLIRTITLKREQEVK